jgi:hypothetical protein
MNCFWWGAQNKGSFTSWMSWNILRLSKLRGGLGLRDVEVFNLAMLAKQVWRFIQHPESLVATVMREKYFPNGSFMKASDKS